MFRRLPRRRCPCLPLKQPKHKPIAAGSSRLGRTTSSKRQRNAFPLCKPRQPKCSPAPILSPKFLTRAAPPIIAPASPVLTTTRRQPPANISSATTSNVQPSRTDVDEQQGSRVVQEPPRHAS